MKFSTPSLVLASVAIAGSTLAAPTPTIPFDSPIQNSPKPDDWAESVRSPRIPRSPLMPALRVAGRRQSIPRFKRQDAPAPDADTANAQGLLGGLGDAVDGLLHQIEGVANGLPIIGGLGILSSDGSDPNADPSADPSQPQKRDVPSAPVPSPSTPLDQTEAIRQMLLQQQQQAAAAFGATGLSMPVNPFALEQRLLALQQAQMMSPTPGQTPPGGGSSIQSLLGGVPLLGGLTGGLLSNGGLNLNGILSPVEGLVGGLPLVGGLTGGILGPNGLVPDLLNDVQADANTVLGGVTNIAGGVLGGGNGQANLLGGILGGSIPGAPPTVPPNTPAVDPTSMAFGSFAVDDDNLPAVSPANDGASVPMDQSGNESSLEQQPDAPLDTTPSESAPVSAPAPSPSSATPVRRRVDGDMIGEGPSSSEADESANGFDPTMPDSNYAPPLLAHTKRATCNGVAEGSMHEGGCDAVPGPQDAITKTSTAPRPKKRMVRRLRGMSLSF